MERNEQILAVLEEMADTDILEAWNNYCDNNNYFDDKIFYMSEFEDIFYNEKITLDFVKNLQDCDFDAEDDYFTWDGSDINTFSDLYEVADLGTLADYMDDNEDDLGIYEVGDIFDEEDEEDDEE